MLNLSALFYTEEEGQPCFLSNLNLADWERSSIREARTEVRRTLKRNVPRIYKEKGYDGVPEPRFFTQGSWAYKTLNGPSQVPQQADIDDGCYLPIGFLSMTKRPKVAANVFFEVVLEALEPLTKERGWPIATKPTCIRIEISSTAHLDLPLYAIPDDEFETLAKAALTADFSDALSEEQERDLWEKLPTEKVMLAHRDLGWLHSDPRPIKDWFLDQVGVKGEQFRRVVRYLKAWRDWNWDEGGPSSILLMAAAAPLFERMVRREDEALLNVVRQMPLRLRQGVLNPVNPTESFTERLRRSDKEKDLLEEAAEKFQEFSNNLSATLAAGNASQGCTWMRQMVGGRFPDRPDMVKVNPAAAAGASTSIAAAIASSPAMAGPEEIPDRTRAG
jgi:hypothetical protein